MDGSKADHEPTWKKWFVSPDQVDLKREEGLTVRERLWCGSFPWEYECPGQWDKMEKAENKAQRLCPGCKREVYLCSTPEEVEDRKGNPNEVVCFFDEEDSHIEVMCIEPLTPQMELERIEIKFSELAEEYAEDRNNSSVVFRLARLSALLGDNDSAMQFAEWYSEITGESLPELPKSHPEAVGKHILYAESEQEGGGSRVDH